MNRYCKFFGIVLISLLFVSCGVEDNSGNTDGLRLQDYKLLPPPDGKIYFGAFPDFGGPEDNVTKERIKNFEQMVSKNIIWAAFSNNWYNGIVYPKDEIHTIYETGAIPYVRLMPRSDTEEFHTEVEFSLDNILAGKFDTQLTQWAIDARDDDIPIIIDFAVEANGDWFPWSGVLNGAGQIDMYGDIYYPDGPEKYRDAYKHIIDIFRTCQANKITWVFHINLTSVPNEEWNQPKFYYPGDDYIDWIGFSVYGAQSTTEDWVGLEFSTQLEENYRYIKEISSVKPIAVFEFGVTDNHPNGDKVLWLEDAFDTILYGNYDIKAISYWHENWQNEDGSFSTIRVDSSERSLAIFKDKISNTIFISQQE